MSHFYGGVCGNRGPATRGGSKQSGYHSYARSREGQVDVYLWHNARTGKDEWRVVVSDSPSGHEKERFTGTF